MPGGEPHDGKDRRILSSGPEFPSRTLRIVLCNLAQGAVYPFYENGQNSIPITVSEAVKSLHFWPDRRDAQFALTMQERDYANLCALVACGQ